jgi:NitT/TauT family transport system substrate-binding protein
MQLFTLSSRPRRPLTGWPGSGGERPSTVSVSEPESVARRMVDGGFAQSYDYALKTLSDARFDRWREFDPEDTMRFYALRLHEVGMINSSPNRIIAEGTDWRFVNELKRELKA